MEYYDDADTISPQTFTRVQKWISQHDFKSDEVKKEVEGETVSFSILSIFFLPTFFFRFNLALGLPYLKLFFDYLVAQSLFIVY